MLTAAQLRAARGLIDWTRNELAKAAKVSPETIKNIEHGIFRPQEETEAKIVKAFAEQDVVFTEDNGVKIRKDSITHLQGLEDFKRFMDDVYANAQQTYSIDGSKPICVCNVDNNIFKQHLGSYAATHIERMSKIEGLKIRMLATKKEDRKFPDARYMVTKYISGTDPQPFYVFGNKFSIIDFTEKNPPQIIVINSPVVAKSYRSQFDVMWAAASTDKKK